MNSLIKTIGSWTFLGLMSGLLFSAIADNMYPTIFIYSSIEDPNLEDLIVTEEYLMDSIEIDEEHILYDCPGVGIKTESEVNDLEFVGCTLHNKTEDNKTSQDLEIGQFDIIDSLPSGLMLIDTILGPMAIGPILEPTDIPLLDFQINQTLNLEIICVNGKVPSGIITFRYENNTYTNTNFYRLCGRFRHE